MLVRFVGCCCGLLVLIAYFMGFAIAHDFCLYGMQILLWLVLSVVLWLDGCFLVMVLYN